MDDNRYNVLYLKKNSLCSTKSKSEETEKETNKKSSGDLNNFATGIPRNITIHKKEVISKIIIDRKLQIFKFNCQAFQSLSLIHFDLKSICEIALKICLCLLDLLIEVFFNQRVHNILAIILTVTIEVFVVLVFAVSTILSAILINIDEAYNKKPESNNLKTSPSKKPKDLDKAEDALKLKTDGTIIRGKSSTSVNSQKNSENDSKILKLKPPNLGDSGATLSDQSIKYKTLETSPT